MRIKMLGFLVLTVALAGAVLLGTPRRAAACNCVGSGGSSEYTGSGADCTAARADWRSQANAEAQTTCYPDGVCGNSYVVTVPCAYDSTTGLYEETGFDNFRCYICF